MDPFLSSIPVDPPPPPIIPFVPSAVVNQSTTTVVGGLPNHPPYSDMICEAIGALKEKHGSSKRAIGKYIESAYKDLPPTHPALLTHHLKRLKNSGLLFMVKKSYKLASAAARSEASLPDSTLPNPADASPGSKRGRGRPPKSKPALPVADLNSLQQPVPLADGLKKSPGRPRKNGPVQVGARGRPSKSVPKKSPGRPRKPKTVRSVVGANAMKRGRGRPPKGLNQLPPQAVMPIHVQGQPMAVPYADADAASAVANSPAPGGRPKGSAGAAGVGIVVSGRRRGRPPKIGGVTANPIKPQKTTGKPVGRPKKKTTDGAESKASKAAYGDLKRKLEFFQSKVKQAVGVLKPQFTNESNISAIGAIQELEGLVAMDISTPFKVDAQLPPPTLAPAQPVPPQNGGQVH